MHEIWQDARFAVRIFRSSPGVFSAIVLTLALAIGGNLTVLSWVEGLMFHPMAGVSDQDRIVAIAGIRQPADRCCSF